MYLLDTNVVSELRKAKSGKAHPAVVAWVAAQAQSSLYLSVVSVLELEAGVLLCERKDKAQGLLLRRWLEEQVMPAFANRLLPIDSKIARACAALHIPNPRSERDALIAATAQVHAMTVVSRNVADFAPMGVPWCNPWAATPAQ